VTCLREESVLDHDIRLELELQPHSDSLVSSEDVYLNVRLLSEITRIPMRTIRWKCQKCRVDALLLPGNGGLQYRMELSKLPSSVQLKWVFRYPDKAVELDKKIQLKLSEAAREAIFNFAHPEAAPLSMDTSTSSLESAVSPSAPLITPPFCGAEPFSNPGERSPLKPSEPFSERLSAVAPVAPADPAPKSGPGSFSSDALWHWYAGQDAGVKGEAERRLKILGEVENEMKALPYGRALNIVAAKHNIARRTLARWWSRVKGAEAADRLPLLAPAKRGQKKQETIFKAPWEWFKEDYYRLEKPTAKACYRRLESKCIEEGIQIPSYKTVLRLMQAMDPAVVKLTREGPKALKRMYPHQERTVKGMHAMEAINGDGYRHNVLVAFPDSSAKDGFRVARPVTWAWQDIYSRKWLGWRTDLSENSTMLHLALMDVLGTFGIPDLCTIDNTHAAANKFLTGGVDHRFRYKIRENEPLGVLPRAGIEYKPCTPAWGQAKPIERHFGIGGLSEYCDKDTRLQGAYTGRNTMDKPDYDNPADRSRAVSLDIFLEVLQDAFHRLNAIPDRRTEACNGIKSFDEAFADSFQISAIRKATEEQKRMLMLRAEDVFVNENGTFTLDFGSGYGIGKNRYGGEKLRYFATEKTGKKIFVYFDPMNLHGAVWAYTWDNRLICECECLDPVGFYDGKAAKEHANNRKAFVRATREKARAEIALADSRANRALPPVPVPPVPNSKVVQVKFKKDTQAELPEVAQVVNARAEQAEAMDLLAGGDLHFEDKHLSIDDFAAQMGIGPEDEPAN